MVGLAKQCTRLLLASRLPDIYWSYAMRFAAEMLRHKALGFTWNTPAFGEEVGMWRSQDKKLIKSANNRGAIGRLIEVTPWQNGTTSLVAKGSDLQDPVIIQGLQPKIVAVECLRLSEPRIVPEGWTKSALTSMRKHAFVYKDRIMKVFRFITEFGLVKPGTLYQCTKACYGLREAPKLWEESRDKTLTVFNFMIAGDTYSLRQSVYHPSLWFVVKAPCLARPQAVRLPDESDLPDLTAFGERTHLAAILVYVDDFLAAGPRQVLQPLLTQLLHVWKGSNPDFLGREPGDVDTLRYGLYISKATYMPSSKRCLENT